MTRDINNYPNRARIYLMYHELELPGRPLCRSEPGYVRYILTASDFENQVQWLQSIAWQGIDTSKARSFPEEEGVVLTFDDGCETDLTSAAPILKQVNFRATFYVTVGFLGRKGYMSRFQLRELSNLGFEIGCHSMTHPYLTDLPDAALHQEVAVSKAELEQIIGRPVDHFSCPGGRWTPRVAEIARRSGYRSVATSRPTANSLHSDPFCLGRIAVMRGTSLPRFQRICRGQGLLRLKFSDLVRSNAKRLLGNSAYDFIRFRVLGGSASDE